MILASRLLSKEPDESVLYTAVDTRRALRKIIQFDSATFWVTAVAIVGDGRRLAIFRTSRNSKRTAPRAHRLLLWDIETGRPIGEPLVDHVQSHRFVALSPDGHRLVTTTSEPTLHLWDADSGEPIGNPLVGHTGPIRCTAFSPDSRRIATSGDDKTVRLWDALTSEAVDTFPVGHTGSLPLRCIAFSPDGTCLATGGGDDTVKVWYALTGDPVGDPCTGHEHGVRSVAWGPDKLITADGNNSVRRWDTRGNMTELWVGHWLGEVTLNPSGDRSIRVGKGIEREVPKYMRMPGSVTLFDTDAGQPRWQETVRPLKNGSTVTFSADGKSAAFDENGTVWLWNLHSLQIIGEPRAGHTGYVTSFAFGPDGRSLASAGRDNAIRLWDVHPRYPLIIKGEHCAAYSPDGRLLATSLGDLVLLWDARSGQLMYHAYPKHYKYLPRRVRMVFSPDGRRTAVADDWAQLRLWNIYTDESPQPLLAGRARCMDSVAFSPDGQHIATASHTQVRMWDAHTGQRTRTLFLGHTAGVESVAFSPDGRHLATGSTDTTARLWDALTGRPITHPLAGHTASVSCMAFSPDGRHLATGSSDKSVRLWDAHTGEPIGIPFTGHVTAVESVSFSPDGLHITAATESDVRVWPATADPEELRAKLTANMSRKQWREWVSPDIPYMEVCPGLPIPPDEPN